VPGSGHLFPEISLEIRSPYPSGPRRELQAHSCRSYPALNAGGAQQTMNTRRLLERQARRAGPGLPELAPLEPQDEHVVMVRTS